MKQKILLAMAVLFLGGSAALAGEKLLVCGPCSREFIPVAQKVVADLKLDVQVEVGPMRCVGYCDEPAVISFREEVYTKMDESKLRSMLEAMVK